MKKAVKVLSLIIAFLIVAPLGVNISKAVTLNTTFYVIKLNTTFYVIKDFYELNWRRDYWDTGLNSIDGAAGSVVYSERGDSMTVTYTGIYETGGRNNIMWGVNELIDPAKRDFSSGEFFANEVKNELNTEAKYQLIVSHSLEDKGSIYPQDQKTYYLLSKDGQITEGRVQASFFKIPANFDGMLIIPMDAYPNINKTHIMRYSIGFPRGESGKLTFGRWGYLDNDAWMSGGKIVVQDETVYFDLPEKIILPKAPYRPITEPPTAAENRTK